MLKKATRKSPRKLLKRKNRQSETKKINNLQREPHLWVFQGIVGTLKRRLRSVTPNLILQCLARYANSSLLSSISLFKDGSLATFRKTWTPLFFSGFTEKKHIILWASPFPAQAIHLCFRTLRETAPFVPRQPRYPDS